MTNSSADVAGTPYDGDISCEGTNSANRDFYINQGLPVIVNSCLNKDDLFVILDFEQPFLNSPRMNLYKADNIWKYPYEWSVKDKVL